MRDFPLRAWVYTALVAAGAGFLTAGMLRGHEMEVATLLGFGLLFLLAELFPVALTYASYSVSFVVALAAIIAVGPGIAALAACFAALDFGLRQRPDWLGRLIFNGGQLALSTALAGLTYRALGGPIGVVSGGDFPAALVPIACAATVYFIANVALVAGMLRLVRFVPWNELWHSNYRAASLSHFSFAVLGVVLALLYVNVGWGSLLFLLLPLLVARGAFQASAKLQDAFDATFRSLVSAIEAKDLYTRGHAERVSRLSAMVAREYGLPPKQVRKVRYAALMHDVGKLIVDTRILQKPGKLTVEEFEHMKIHPIRGSEIVSKIDLLEEMVDGVRHHHERMDGKGYPDGLVAEELSKVARMIMVADAFDSMTSTRSYRRAVPMEAAFAELRRCQGTQFAEEMVDALERAIAKHGWQPAPETFQGELTPRPEVSPHAANA